MTEPLFSPISDPQINWLTNPKWVYLKRKWWVRHSGFSKPSEHELHEIYQNGVDLFTNNESYI